jgi:enolase
VVSVPGIAPLRLAGVDALEILDSRGQPTLQVMLDTGAGVVGASVPAGASTGSREAVEQRDGDRARYAGRGVRHALSNVTGPLRELLLSRPWRDLAELDEALRACDGSPDKSQLGANAIVGVSMAAARAFAAEAGVPLYLYLAGGRQIRLPVPHFNVVNGGAHATNALQFQEFMLAPVGAPDIAEAVRAGAEIYAALRSRLAAQGHQTGLGDEGGFAPDIGNPVEVCALLVAAVDDAGYSAGPDGVMLALDPAANGFRDAAGRYRLTADLSLTSQELVDYYAELVDRFPIWSVEDGHAEDDDEGWRAMTDRLGQRVQLVGDDLFVTDAAMIDAGADRKIANAALVKVNQIGTVTETLAALETCRRRGYAAMVSHRSGETLDTFISDLAVGAGCGQLKSGAPARGERVAKYNRLLAIWAANPSAPYGLPSGSLRG